MTALTELWQQYKASIPAKQYTGDGNWEIPTEIPDPSGAKEYDGDGNWVPKMIPVIIQPANEFLEQAGYFAPNLYNLKSNWPEILPGLTGGAAPEFVADLGYVYPILPGQNFALTIAPYGAGASAFSWDRLSGPVMVMGAAFGAALIGGAIAGAGAAAGEAGIGAAAGEIGGELAVGELAAGEFAAGELAAGEFGAELAAEEFAGELAFEEFGGEILMEEGMGELGSEFVLEEGTLSVPPSQMPSAPPSSGISWPSATQIAQKALPTALKALSQPGRAALPAPRTVGAPRPLYLTAQDEGYLTDFENNRMLWIGAGTLAGLGLIFLTTRKGKRS